MHNSLEFVDLETIDLVELKDEKLDKFESIFNLKNPDRIFYNSTNLVFMDINDYGKVKMVFGDKLEDVLKVEIREFNTYVYIVRYLNVEYLEKVLKG